MTSVDPFCCRCFEHHDPSTRHRRLRHWLRTRAARTGLAVDRLRGRRDGL